MRKLCLLLYLLVFCLLFSSCHLSSPSSEPISTPIPTPIVIDYTSFMSDNLVSALEYFNMTRSEFEVLAFPNCESDIQYYRDNTYDLGEISFLDYKGYAIAEWTSNQSSNVLYKIYIITDLTNDDMENVKNQLETVLHTKCFIDRYEDEKQYLFDIAIPNSNYGIRSEYYKPQGRRLELWIYCNQDTTTQKDPTIHKNIDYSSYLTTNNARHTDSEAWTCAKKIVKDSLKAPSTAKFCSFPESKVKHLGNGEYMVTGWVEAQNSFGAMLRQSFVVTYTATESGYKNGIAIID